MKNSLILALGLLLAAPHFLETPAHAYSSNVGTDPKESDGGTGNAGYGDLETKTIVKSAVAGESASIAARRVLAYAQTADDGYTVTRMVTRSAVGFRRLACVSLDDIASGDTSYHRCITKGFVRLKYDASTFPIEDGVAACVNQEGIVTGCNLSVAGEATANTRIVPLEAKTSGTGDYLRAMINLQ